MANRSPHAGGDREAAFIARECHAEFYSDGRDVLARDSCDSGGGFDGHGRSGRNDGRALDHPWTAQFSLAGRAPQPFLLAREGPSNATQCYRHRRVHGVCRCGGYSDISCLRCNGRPCCVPTCLWIRVCRGGRESVSRTREEIQRANALTGWSQARRIGTWRDADAGRRRGSSRSLPMVGRCTAALREQRVARRGGGPLADRD
jgi:hypothetical protein